MSIENVFKALDLSDDVYDNIANAFGDLTKNKQTTSQRREAAERLAQLIKDHGVRILKDGEIMENVVAALEFKGSEHAREGALLALEAFASLPECEPHLIPLIPSMLDKYSDKKPNVRQAAEDAATKLVDHLSPYSVHDILLPLLFSSMANEKKWQTIRGSLTLLGTLARHAPAYVCLSLPDIIPIVSESTHYLKKEVKEAAVKALKEICQTIDNRDIESFIPNVVESIENPEKVPDCIKELSGVTFVSRVTAPALSIITPLLNRGLQEKRQITLRQVAVISDNMAKLVDEKAVAHQFLPQLLSGLDRIVDVVGDPEIRYMAAKAIVTITKVGGGDGVERDLNEILNMDFATPVVTDIHHILSKRDLERLEEQKRNDNEKRKQQKAIEDEHFNLDNAGADEVSIPLITKQEVLDALKRVLLTILPQSDLDDFLLVSVDYIAALATALVHIGNFDVEEWNAHFEQRGYLGFVPQSYRLKICEQFLSECEEMENQRLAKFQDQDDDDTEEGSILCNCEFSLAYGGMILLNKAKMKLRRGAKYGVCGRNGVGKSTLMKAIANGQLEGFPSDQLISVYVGHDLQAEEADKPVLDFILEDEKLNGNVSSSEVKKVLDKVGFTKTMQMQPFSSLSGGWKMKLELARAMLMHADILLLDEPTNHLDFVNVAWLEKYLCNLTDVTCLIVSHDSSFLDNVCTHIIDYDKKKLKFFKGNLTNFVKVKPEAKTYYDLSATDMKFIFPKPGLLEGIKSKNRAILKMKNVCYTYPNATVRALNNISISCSLSSRVSINGPNGAGKSTLIKLLTGEYVPDSGEVWKHPTLRVSYVAQHAFHHVEQHLDISPNEYIQWRYQYGEDKELLQKQTRQLSEDEKQELNREIVGKNGQVRRVEALLGRRKLKKSFEYEVKFVGMLPKHNVWMPLERLEELGFSKLMQAFDDKEAAREGLAANNKPLSVSGIQQHLDDFGLEAEFGTHGLIRGLSGGQKVKLVLAAAMWNNPHLLVLDEPTNYLDRSALGALSKAIVDFEGGIVMISHNSEFTKPLAKDVWNVEAGRIASVYKDGVIVSTGGDEEGEEEGWSSGPGSVTSGRDSDMADLSDKEIAQKVKASSSRKKKPTRRELKERELQKRMLYLRGEVSTMREVEELDKEGALELPSK